MRERSELQSSINRLEQKRKRVSSECTKKGNLGTYERADIQHEVCVIYTSSLSYSTYNMVISYKPCHINLARFREGLELWLCKEIVKLFGPEEIHMY